MSEKNKKRMQGYKHNKVRRSQNKAGRTTLRTREGFLRKNIVAVSFFKTVLYTNILYTFTYLFH